MTKKYERAAQPARHAAVQKSVTKCYDPNLIRAVRSQVERDMSDLYGGRTSFALVWNYTGENRSDISDVANLGVRRRELVLYDTLVRPTNLVGPYYDAILKVLTDFRSNSAANNLEACFSFTQYDSRTDAERSRPHENLRSKIIKEFSGLTLIVAEGANARELERKRKKQVVVDNGDRPIGYLVQKIYESTQDFAAPVLGFIKTQDGHFLDQVHVWNLCMRPNDGEWVEVKDGLDASKRV